MRAGIQPRRDAIVQHVLKPLLLAHHDAENIRSVNVFGLSETAKHLSEKHDGRKKEGNREKKRGGDDPHTPPCQSTPAPWTESCLRCVPARRIERGELRSPFGRAPLDRMPPFAPSPYPTKKKQAHTNQKRALRQNSLLKPLLDMSLRNRLEQQNEKFVYRVPHSEAIMSRVPHERLDSLERLPVSVNQLQRNVQGQQQLQLSAVVVGRGRRGRGRGGGRRCPRNVRGLDWEPVNISHRKNGANWSCYAHPRSISIPPSPIPSTGAAGVAV